MDGSHQWWWVTILWWILVCVGRANYARCTFRVHQYESSFCFFCFTLSISQVFIQELSKLISIQPMVIGVERWLHVCFVCCVASFMKLMILLNSMQGEYRVDALASKTMKNCLMYKMCYYRFGETMTEYGLGLCDNSVSWWFHIRWLSMIWM